MRIWDQDDNIQTMVTYEFDKSLRMVNRKVFSIMDLFSAIGGLAGALKALFTIGVVVF